MHREDKNRIGIFVYGYGLGNSPSLINAGKSLAGAGFYVDYFPYRTFVGNIQFDNPKITVHSFGEDSKGENKGYVDVLKDFMPPSFRITMGRMYGQAMDTKSELIRKVFYGNNANAFESEILSDIKQYVCKVEDIIKKNHYKCFIGVEPEGLIAAGMIGEKQKIPVVYYNMELRLTSECRNISEKIIKKHEKIYNKSAIFTIIQDEERAMLLESDNETGMQEFLTVPVCADGPRFEQRTDWLRKKFNLSDNDRIILYAGFISEWASCEEIATSAVSWPKNRILIIHSHGYYDPAYLQKLKKYEGEKVKISLDPVPYDDLSSFLASADIGIALYKDLGKNFTAIGSASGKLAHYLKSGLPVITNDYPSVRKIIDSYECGVCIDSPQKIIYAMEKIFEEYDIMRQNAFRCYEDKYMFSKNFSKVIERIKGL